MTNEKLESYENYKEDKDEERRRRYENKQDVKEKKDIKEKKAESTDSADCVISQINKQNQNMKNTDIEKEVGILESKSENFGVSLKNIKSDEVVNLEKTVDTSSEDKSIEYLPKELMVPIIKLINPIEVKCDIQFDKEPIYIQESFLKNITIPLYRVCKFSVRTEIRSFDNECSEKIIRMLKEICIETTEEVEEITKDEISNKIDSEESPESNGRQNTNETFDIINFLIGVHSGRILSNGPKVILYKELEKDSSIGTFTTICALILKYHNIGPKLMPRYKCDDFNKRDIEKWIEPGNIIIVDLDSGFKSWFDEDNLKEVLRRFIFGRVGFLIFKTRDSDSYITYKTILEKLRNNIEGNVDIIYAEPRQLSFEAKKELSSLSWGNIDINVLPISLIQDKKSDRPYGYTLDDISNKYAKGFYEEYMENLAKGNNMIYALATFEHEGESAEHRYLKIFILRWRAKRKGLMDYTDIVKNIKTEMKIREGICPTPDINVEKIVDEVETYFAEDREGKTPAVKTRHSITKYEEISSVEEINICLDNLTLMMHLDDILGVNKTLKNWAKANKKLINFYGIDCKDNKPLPLKDIMTRIKKLSEL